MSGQIKKWIQQHKLAVNYVLDHLFDIEDVGRFYVLGDKDKVFGESFNLEINAKEFDEASKTGANFYVYRFGGRYYYTPTNNIQEPQLLPFRHIGKACQELVGTTHLGVHGSYELLNGSRDYRDWCTKAKFLQYSSLGICERGTLAGTLAFQLECEKAGLKPILGETISVDFKDNKKLYDVKVYAMNDIGWRNILNLNKIINIDSVNRAVTIEDLIDRSEGIALVVTPEIPFNTLMVATLTDAFKWLFCQFSPVQFTSPQRDRQWLDAHKLYLDHWIDRIPPVLVDDAYYLDIDDYAIKPILNKIGGISSHGSDKQYLRAIDEIFEEIAPLFREEDERVFEVFENALKNAERISSECEFKIQLGQLHLPKYEMNADEAEKYATNEDLFWGIIEQSLQTLTPAKGFDLAEYMDRVEKEADVITRGGFQDYFLILWDINNWCRKQRILTGIGRGSAGGSLIAYLMGITKLDPLRYGLLFERFLNESRIKSSLPDIDTDFEGERREEVKQYMIDKYGYEYVCSVGTYTTFGLKGAIKDLARQFNVDFASSNYITAILDAEEEKFREIFVQAVQKPQIKQFIQDNPEMINLIPLCLGQPKTASIHACATLIVPKTDANGNPMTIYDWLPVRKTADGQLISEWEGGYTEAAGFLKEDILGIKQLDKFRAIFDLVEKTTGVQLQLEDIPLDEPGVFELFKQGHSEDVFHLGTQGLIGYGKQVQPDNIEDLIAMIALHRPGTMNSGAHNTYVKCKFGQEEVRYDYGLEEVTKDTFGLYIYQEQVMKAVQVLGGLSLVDADGVRKAMGKKIKEKMDGYKAMFVEGALAKGCPQDEADRIWDTLEVFSGYGFNKSHAAAYSITGYICNWLKYKYPMQFWTVAFDYAADADLPRYISEISNTNNTISIRPPDINGSQAKFSADFSTGNLYWSLSKVKQCGDSATQAIIEERERGGKFFDLQDAYDRLPKGQVKKNVWINLILSGSFDSLYNLEDARASGRLTILKHYFELRREKLPDEFLGKQTYWWQLQQKSISGYGQFDYRSIIRKSSRCKTMFNMFADGVALEEIKQTERQRRVVAGVVVQVVEKQSKNGKFANIVIDCNSEMIPITFWAGEWINARKEVLDSKDRILIVEGRVQFDSFKYQKNIINTDKDTVFEVL